jgi:hypothetical protein
MKWWRKDLNREATITIHPADTGNTNLVHLLANVCELFINFVG